MNPPVSSTGATLARSALSSGANCCSSSWLAESERSRASDCEPRCPPPIQPTSTRRPFTFTCFGSALPSVRAIASEP